MIDLFELVKPKPKTQLAKVAKESMGSQYVNSKDLIPLGITVPMEKPLAFINEKKTELASVNKLDNKNLIDAILSKNPHYEYQKKIRGGFFNKVRYIFKDTKRNILVIVTKNQANDLIQIK